MIDMPVTWLDREVKGVVGAAHELASGGARTVIGEEHLLAAVLETHVGKWLAPLSSAEVREEILPAVSRARLTGGLSATDQAALDGLGVDLPSLARQVDSLDTGDALRSPARPAGGWSQRMTDAAAVVLARAEDLTVAGGSRSVGLPELVTALVEVPSLVTEHLAARGITAESVQLHRPGGDGS